MKKYLALLLFSGVHLFAAELPPHLTTGRYHLILGPASACESTLEPTMGQNGQGKPVLFLSGSLAYIFQGSAPTCLPSNRCSECNHSTLHEDESVTTFTFEVDSDCGKGSHLDTIRLKGNEIVFSSQVVVKTDAGKWQAQGLDESGFSCIWKHD